MTDTVDRATDYADEWLEAQVKASLPTPPAGPSLTICIDCDEPIPEGRRLAAPGCKRCTPCESDYQQRVRQHG